MSKTIGFSLLLICILTSCRNSLKKADLLIFNANIYTVDQTFSVCEAMAVKDGKIVATGSSEQIISEWDAVEKTNLNGASVFPGFIDAHCHFMAYGLGLGKIDLIGTQSFDEVLQRVVRSTERHTKPIDQTSQPISSKLNDKWIVGRGWDQNDWQVKEMPDKKQLDSLFPNQPVYLTRIDGHAVLVNSTALKLANINAKTKIKGGEIVVKNNQATGLLIDNAIDLVRKKIPAVSIAEKTEALLNAQENCIRMGLTTVDDAGLMDADVKLIDDLQRKGLLKIRIYAMLSDSLENYNAWLNKGPYKTDRLNVRAFKFYADGALGSRGACLYENYADKKNWKGFLLSDVSHFEKYAELLASKGFQMNTHCIGDSAFGVITTIALKYCKGNGLKRWRIEHAQVTAAKDVIKLNEDVIPSVQPTHATSDMYWVEERLGKERTKTAYAYRTLLQKTERLALGTDFPVEDISPFKTFHSAVFRQDDKNFPPGGFQIENVLTKEAAIRGMSIWAAYANFEENEKGSLEPGKFADFIVLDHDLMRCNNKDVLKTNVISTYIAGEKVSGK